MEKIEYKFENKLNSNITVLIIASCEDEAYDLLGITVVDHNDFDLV